MASRRGHLGATGDREVVFCHACSNEWYRDEYGSQSCPSCDSSFTEIVDASHDPRDMNDMRIPSSSSSSGHFFRRADGSDSDPDEGDIEEHVHEGPSGWSARRSPLEPLFGAAARDDRERDRTNVNEGDAILRRFADMLMNDFGAGRAAGGGAPGAGGLFPPGQTTRQPGTSVHQTTWRAGPFGSTHTRVTITSGTLGAGPEGPVPTFGALFGQLFGNPVTPGADDANRRDRGGPEPGVGFGFGGGLHELLTSLFNPAAAVSGDAVFTQEALDRIITNLMEASPQTNAAPPASQSAIDSLEKKQVDQEMLGAEAKAECTICIDEINKGDEVVVLPCKHWYHGECVVLWLKEHNTCPICRKPIETRGEGGNNTDSPNSSNSQQPQQAPQPRSPSTSTPTSPSGSTSASASASASASTFSPYASFTPLTPLPIPSSRSRSDRLFRSQRENADRLNQIRNLASGSASPTSNVAGSPQQQQEQRQEQRRRSSLTPLSSPGAWPLASSSDRDLFQPMEGLEYQHPQQRDEELESSRDPWSSGSGSASARRRSSVAGGIGSGSGNGPGSSGQQQGGNGSGSGSGSGGPFGWLRNFGRNSGGGSDRDRRR